MRQDRPQSKDERVKALYEGLGKTPPSIKRKRAYFSAIRKLAVIFSFGFEESDIRTNVVLARLWRWSAPLFFILMMFVIEGMLFVGGGLLKYLLFEQQVGLYESFAFMIGRGIVWGAVLTFLGFWAVVWSASSWKRRQVLLDMKLTEVTAREIMAAIWLPPLLAIMTPMVLFTLLDLAIVPVTRTIFGDPVTEETLMMELTALAGVPFIWSLSYFGLTLALTSSMIPLLKKESVANALVPSAGWMIHHAAIAALKFFFNVWFVIFIILACAGRPFLGFLVYATWWAFQCKDDLKNKIKEQLGEIEKSWWEWIVGE